MAIATAILSLAAFAPAAAGAEGSGGVLVVGDSLEELTSPYLAKYLPGVPLTVNAKGGYNSYQILELFEESYDPSQSVIVFDAGTNDNPSYPQILAENLSKVAATIGNRCMVVPTIHGLHPGGVDDTGKNRTVAEFAASRPGTEVPDWAGFVASHPELMQADNLHPIEAGAQARARLIAQGVLGCLGEGGGARRRGRLERARPRLQAEAPAAGRGDGEEAGRDRQRDCRRSAAPDAGQPRARSSRIRRRPPSLRRHRAAVGLAAGAQRRSADPAGEVLGEALRGVAARLGLGMEDGRLDGEPGEDPARGGEDRADDHPDVEAVGHLRRVVEAVAGEAGDHRQDGDGEQAGDAGDGVVDAGGDSRVAHVGGGEDGRGDRRDDQGQADAEDDHRGQDGRDVAVAGVDPGHQQQAERRSPADRS